MEKAIRAVLVGCGSIGCAVGRLALQRPNIELVGAVDIDRNKVGRDLDRVLDIRDSTGVAVSDDLDDVFGQADADLALHHIGGPLQKIAPQLIRLAGIGVNVVSSNELLAYPHRKQPELTDEIDRAAKANKITILSTGVNPGFVMDTWPLAMTGVCQEVKKVRVVRAQDAGPRRLTFQKKIGAGLTTTEFQQLVDGGTLRHSGMAESIALVAAGLGWELDDITEVVEPIIARDRVHGKHITVEPGHTAGMRQVGRGIRAGEELITMEFEASLGAADPHDAVYISGTPDMEVVLKGGVHGDIGTAAMVVNAARRVVEAQPGLLTMKDIPLLICGGGG